MRRLLLPLTTAQRSELTRLRDHDPKPYVREKAAALLKVADGWTAQAVGAYGLLRPRAADTVAHWVHSFRADGVAGLAVRPGRGRKPAFSPLRSDGRASR
jgi:hypothetical protein